jgi:hypothetical protein
MSSVRNFAVAAAPDRSEWSLFVAAHRVRRTQIGRDRVLVFASDPMVLRWIDHELFAERVTTQVVEALADVVTTLTLVPPPWPHILIADVTAISPAEVALLGTIRDAGWPGMVIAIGAPSFDMQRALGIDLVVDRSLEAETLRKAVGVAEAHGSTPRSRRGATGRSGA